MNKNEEIGGKRYKKILKLCVTHETAKTEERRKLTQKGYEKF